MTRKKNSFLTFIFSTMFGAGHMYMGFMKQGISIMTAAVLIIAAGNWTRLGIIFLALPVLWFYSFFDAINKMTLPDRIFQTLEDHYLFLPTQDNAPLKHLITKYEKAIAIFLILIGATVLCDNLLNFVADQTERYINSGLSDFIRSLRWNGQKILFSVVIIIIGVKMISGKKRELDREEMGYKKNRDSIESIRPQNSNYKEPENSNLHNPTLVAAQRDTQQEIQNGMQKDTRSETQKEVQQEMQKDTPLETQKEMQQEMQKVTQQDIIALDNSIIMEANEVDSKEAKDENA